MFASNTSIGFVATLCLTTVVGASTITLGPTDFNVKDHRTTTDPKPYDLDGDNVYGTLSSGWYGSSAGIFAGSVPSFVTVGVASTTSTLQILGPYNAGPDYGDMDNPTLAPAAAVADVNMGIIGTTTGSPSPQNLFELQIAGANLPSIARVGIAIVGQGEVPTAITLFSYDPGLNVVNSFAAHTVGALPGYDEPDFYFFDITGLYSGEWLVINVTTRNLSPGINFGYISGITFDLPEPGALSVLAVGAVSMLRRRL